MILVIWTYEQFIMSLGTICIINVENPPTLSLLLSFKFVAWGSHSRYRHKQLKKPENFNLLKWTLYVLYHCGYWNTSINNMNIILCSCTHYPFYNKISRLKPREGRWGGNKNTTFFKKLGKGFKSTKCCPKQSKTFFDSFKLNMSLCLWT